MTHAADRTIRIDGLFNMRDVGGLRTGDATVKHGKLLRSDGLHHLTDAGRAQFSELGISTVFDLRDDKERSMAPSKTDGLAVTTVASPIFQGSEQLLTNPNITLDEFYRGMVDGYSENYASTLRAIAQTEGDTVLIHCTAGKDRTGTVAALALTVAGVERDDVLHDYSLTEDNLAGPWLDKHLSMVKRWVSPSRLPCA